jgi:hypothetical protein
MINDCRTGRRQKNLTVKGISVNKHDSDGMGRHKWSPTGYGIVEDV